MSVPAEEVRMGAIGKPKREIFIPVPPRTEPAPAPSPTPVPERPEPVPVGT